MIAVGSTYPTNLSAYCKAAGNPNSSPSFAAYVTRAAKTGRQSGPRTGISSLDLEAAGQPAASLYPDWNALLRYSPETGELTWIANGKAAGTGRVGYVAVRHQGRKYLAHRIAWELMTGHAPAAQIDHINRDKADNRWANLRLASHSENNWNKGVQTNSATGLKGVSFHKASGKFRAQIKLRGRKIHLGLFATADDAAKAYDREASRLFGEFAVLNFQFLSPPRSRSGGAEGRLT